ncbi:5-methyltetrahydropteroyltriglutamate--homocysteine methyltransferase [Paenibacillus shirakamiensis]|uniref:5-methyltetrahydropteroyltriglutamate--homocysteine methyltransferase n=1 Tax=Paenibacillus shirakamiensis TaxID=1265935 RepID=A0ABS4JGZ9_9BACL|nr:5-methyltetrahydropteroyltriglutamate--homocysteine S-methyltransferase [Paenibacillus shirakamiensis]MBP2000983.1 5-methyltetrahydropteroyltriglutamate--homocysteine methyltransferase [Paenibacillus shirakamiensis]
MSNVRSSNLGFPRIGEKREWKKAIELFWAGKIQEADLHKQLAAIRLDNLKLQKEKGVEIIPVNDFTYYDHILDTATMFGVIPTRFNYVGGEVSLATYYGVARGNTEATASEMTKWFNTNYHYIVPELQNVTPQLTINRPLLAYREAKEQLNIEGRPVLVGLYTFLKLSKGYDTSKLDEVIEQFLPLYVQVLQELAAEGAAWVQIDEPILVTTVDQEDYKHIQHIYETLQREVPSISVQLQTYFGAVDQYEELVALPVQGLGLDFVHDQGHNLEALRKFGFPSDKVLAAGIIDGRNVWRADLDAQLAVLQEIQQLAADTQILVQPSSSLLHVPVTARTEEKLDVVLKNALAFAEEKLEELVLLANAANGHKDEQAFAVSREAIQALNASPARNREEVRHAAAHVSEQPSNRAHDFGVRQVEQKKKWQLPFLPTTTIGSFPQTAEVRAARQKWRKGEWSREQYTEFVNAQIKDWIVKQEEIGIDVLVHGEFERTDMVEFFGEKLAGFAFTSFGWVQSYGSRCVKPPVIFGDVEFLAPMTVEETVYAQSLTDKPVKGMLTGPITILNWSFVRTDLSREQVSYQIALALRKEVEALEQAGIEMIQVDEPALREGLPLKRAEWDQYLEWAVLAFKLSTSTVKDTTQIHTHMCYCEFHDIIDSITALDADVISIETSRSHGELVHSFEEHTYPLGIGLGVYDIHSPRVPSVDEMVSMIGRALQVLDPELFWINPDCGLKTRGESETVESLKNMVEAAKQVRVSRSKISV